MAGRGRADTRSGAERQAERWVARELGVRTAAKLAKLPAAAIGDPVRRHICAALAHLSVKSAGLAQAELALALMALDVAEE